MPGRAFEARILAVVAEAIQQLVRRSIRVCTRFSSECRAGFFRVVLSKSAAYDGAHFPFESDTILLISLSKSWPRFVAGVAVMCGLLLGAALAHAEKVQHIYRAAVPVETQSESDRNKGFRAALEQVLIKASGREAKVVSGQLAEKFPSPLGLVQSYGYRENTDWLNHQSRQQGLSGPEAPTGSAANAAPARYLLEVMFAPALVEQQMLRLELPVWGDTRPSILLWVLVEQQGERQLIGNGDLYGLADLLLQDAQRRALPVFLPSADLQDLVAIKMNDLSALKPDAVTEANLRYQPDAHVLLRVVHSGATRWNADWLISLKQETASGQIRDAGLSGVVAALGVELASYLSSRYAVLKPSDDESGATTSTELLLEIDRINSFEDFIALQQHLESLPPLSSVTIEKIEGSRVFCRAQLNSTRQQLFEHVELSGLMQPKLTQAVPQQSVSQGVDVQAVIHAQPERFDWRGDPRGR